MNHLARLSFALLAAALLQPLSAGADEVKSYMRVVDVDDQTLRLDMAVRLFAPADGKGPTIALVAAIHLADEQFYALAQQYLDAQDLILFEGVGYSHQKGDDAPAAKVARTKEHIRAIAVMLERYRTAFNEYPATTAALLKAVGEQSKLKHDRLQRILIDAWNKPLIYARTDAGFTLTSHGADGKPAGSELDADLAYADQPALTKGEINDKGGIQGDLADALGLTFQLHAFDTGRKNYRNSDMTLAQVQERATAGGGDASALVSMMDGSGMLAGLMKIGLAFIKGSPKLQGTMKVMMMEMLQQVGDDMTKMKSVPPKMQALLKVLIEDRNQIVIDDLKKELAAAAAVADGKAPPKSIAVWYGAGHYRDMERRLTSQLGYKPVANFWLPAITTDLTKAGMTKADLDKTRAMLQRMLGGAK